MNVIRRALALAAALAILGPGPSAAPRPREERKDTVKARLHIISSSHQDIAWMDSPEKCIVFRDTNCITPALAMMAKDPAYSFTMENMLNLAEYLERHPERAEEVGRLTREGRMEWGATFNQPYESLLTGEYLIREAYFGRLWLKKNFPGADARVYFNPDVPGRAAQMPQILAKAGIPYMVMSRYHEGFYRWASPTARRSWPTRRAITGTPRPTSTPRRPKGPRPSRTSWPSGRSITPGGASRPNIRSSIPSTSPSRPISAR